MYKWFLFFFLVCPLSDGAQKNDALVLTHITVIDCTGAPPKPDSTVIITGSQITAVGPQASISIPAPAALARLSMALRRAWRIGSPCAPPIRRGKQCIN